MRFLNFIIFGFSFLALTIFSSCGEDKDDPTFSIEVTNPYNADVNVSIGLNVASEEVLANSSRTFIGTSISGREEGNFFLATYSDEPAGTTDIPSFFALLELGNNYSWVVGTTQVNNLNGSSDGTNSDPDCTDWDYYKGQCLGTSGTSGENSSAGIRQKACIMSQTATSMTVEVTIEPANGGIDPNFSYTGLNIYFRGGESFDLSVSAFNSGGPIMRTITANKSDIDQFWLDNWKTSGSIAFVEATCIYD